MTITFKNFSLGMIFILIIFSSCEKGEIIDPNSEYLIMQNENTWNLHKFISNEPIYNIYSNSDELIIASAHSVYSLDSLGQPEHRGSIPTGFLIFPALSDNCCVTTVSDLSYLVFHPIAKIGTGYISNLQNKYIHLNELGENLQLGHPVSYIMGAINKKNQYLGAIHNPFKGWQFLFISYHIKNLPDQVYSVEIDTIQISDYNTGIGFPHSISASDEDFFVGTTPLGNFRVDTLGQIYKIDLLPDDAMMQFFMIEDIYYSITFLEKKIFRSLDHGHNWEYQAEIQCPDTLQFRPFDIIDDQLILANLGEDKLYKVDITDGTYLPLNNKGLEDKDINSISHLGNYMFIATNQGLYFKKLDYILN